MLHFYSKWFTQRNPKRTLKNGRHFEDPKTPLRHTGSFTLPLEGPWGFLGQACKVALARQRHFVFFSGFLTSVGPPLLPGIFLPKRPRRFESGWCFKGQGPSELDISTSKQKIPWMPAIAPNSGKNSCNLRRYDLIRKQFWSNLIIFDSIWWFIYRRKAICLQENISSWYHFG